MSTRSLIKFHLSFILQNHAPGELSGKVLFMLKKLHPTDFDHMPSYDVREHFHYSWK